MINKACSFHQGSEISESPVQNKLVRGYFDMRVNLTLESAAFNNRGKVRHKKSLGYDSQFIFFWVSSIA
jgi:hypothetical protein